MAHEETPASPEYWETRYRSERSIWDLWQPAPALTAWLERHPGQGRRAIVLGCGRGFDAVALAQAGFEVTAVDFAPSAIAAAQELADREGVSLELYEHDLFTLDAAFNGAFDLVFEHTFFCVLPPERRPEYRQLVTRLLRPGGLLVGIFFTFEDDEEGPPFGVTPAELRALFASQFEVETLALVDNSVERRQGEEHLGVFRRRAD